MAKINMPTTGKKHYLWVCIDSETRLVTSWNLNQSRGSECAFSLFKQAKTFGSPKSIVTDGLPSYIEPIKNTFKDSTHIVVKDFDDDISNNLTPAEVCGINYTHQEKVNWFIKY